MWECDNGTAVEAVQPEIPPANTNAWSNSNDTGNNNSWGSNDSGNNNNWSNNTATNSNSWENSNTNKNFEQRFDERGNETDNQAQRKKYDGLNADGTTFGDNLPVQTWEEELTVFEKNFYYESPSVQQMTEDEVVAFRNDRCIQVEGNDIPKPIRTFEESSFPGKIFTSNNCKQYSEFWEYFHCNNFQSI